MKAKSRMCVQCTRFVGIQKYVIARSRCCGGIASGRVGRKADSASGESRRERRSIDGYYSTMSSICDYPPSSILLPAPAEGRRGAGYQYPFGDPARLLAFPRARIGDASQRDEIRPIDSHESRWRTLTRLHRGLARKWAEMSGMQRGNAMYTEIRYRNGG